MVSDRAPETRTGLAFAMLCSPSLPPEPGRSAIVAAIFAVAYFVTGALVAAAAPEISRRVQMVVAQWP